MTRRNDGLDDDLEEVLSAILLQRRLVLFASDLEGVDREILDRRLLATYPASISRLARELSMPYIETKRRVRALEGRLREALRDPERRRARAA